MKRVAFVMVNHNGGDEVLQSARSVLDDLADQDLLVLVDNGSTDGSGEKAARELPRLKYIANSSNLTFAEATNIGIQYALGQEASFVGPINPDVRVLPGMTTALVHALTLKRQFPTAAVSPVMLYEEPENRIWYAGGRIFWTLGWLGHRGNGRSVKHAHLFAGATNYVTGCCWLSPAHIWQKVGLLDSSYGMYAEDVDWSIRARRHEYALVVDPSALLVHRLSQSSGGGRNPFKMTYRTRATRLFFHRYTPAAQKPFQAVGAWLVQQAYSLFLLVRHGSESMKAYRDAWKVDVEERIPWPPSR